MEVIGERRGRRGADRPSGRQIFEPFRTGQRPQRSSGVGLAICKAIVEAHGGTITVGDARPAGAAPGCPFTFTLPRHHARAVGG